MSAILPQTLNPLYEITCDHFSKWFDNMYWDIDLIPAENCQPFIDKVIQLLMTPYMIIYFRDHLERFEDCLEIIYDLMQRKGDSVAEQRRVINDLYNYQFHRIECSRPTPPIAYRTPVLVWIGSSDDDENDPDKIWPFEMVHPAEKTRSYFALIERVELLLKYLF